MTGCKDTNSLVYLSKSDNPKRKYEYTWEYASASSININGSPHKICVNTNKANKVVLDALKKHNIAELADYSTIRPEQKVNNSRIDFLLQGDGLPDCYLEVKSVTLAHGQTAMFPDTVTTRGQKHCYELAQLSKQGLQAKLLFCVMRESITQFKIAHHLDPDYAKAVKFAVEQGVEVLCYGCELDLLGIKLTHKIEFIDYN
jgi:sugar fermentation stimulation protein A